VLDISSVPDAPLNWGDGPMLPVAPALVLPGPPPPPEFPTEFQFYFGRDYFALPCPPELWVVQDLIAAGGIVNMYGLPKTRKSFVALAIAAAVANGDPDWEGFDILTPGNVAYLQIDTPRGIWRNRMFKLQGAGLNFDKVAMADLGSVPYPVNILEPGTVDKLRRALDVIQPVLVVIDTLRDAFRGDENSSDIMTGALQQLVSATRPAATLLLSHQRKDSAMTKAAEETTEDGGLMDGGRGSGSLSGRMDMIIRLTMKTFAFRGRTERSGRFPVTHDEHGLVRLVQEGLKKHDDYLRGLLITDPTLSNTAWAAKLAGTDPMVGSYSASTLRQHLPSLRGATYAQ